MRSIVAAAIAVAALTYQPPVPGPVVDPFRPPEHPYGPGNRGVDLATEPGDPVVAAAGGVVTFAGPVGRSLHVTVRHSDGIRTTYSFLRSVSVARGDRVAARDPVGTAERSVHIGARRPDGTYVDPTTLWGRTRVRLVE